MRHISIALLAVLVMSSVAAAQRILRSDTAIIIIVGPFLDATDRVTAEDSLDVTTIDCDLYKNGASITTISLTGAGVSVNDCVHVANGYYSLELTSGNLDTEGYLRITFNVAGVAPVCEDFLVQNSPRYNTEILGGDWYPANVGSVSGSTTAADDMEDLVLNGYDATNNRMRSDMTAVSGDATAADALEDFVEQGYDSNTNTVATGVNRTATIGTVTSQTQFALTASAAGQFEVGQLIALHNPIFGYLTPCVRRITAFDGTNVTLSAAPTFILVSSSSQYIRALPFHTAATKIDAIDSKTTKLPTDPADQSELVAEHDVGQLGVRPCFQAFAVMVGSPVWRDLYELNLRGRSIT